MPFQADHGWPENLRNIFNFRQNEPGRLESRYYGPIVTLLTYCFWSETSPFYVADQQVSSRDDNRTAVDYCVFVVRPASHDPVLFVEVKDDQWLRSAELRSKADLQMRARFRDMIDACPLRRLWGLSLIGPNLRVYCKDKTTGKLDPQRQNPPGPSTVLLPKDFLDGEWNINLMTGEGFQKMREIVEDILAQCQNI